MSDPCWPTINQRICDIYGLNPDDVREVRITFTPSSVPAVAVKLNANEGTVWIILDVLDGKVMG